MVYAKPRAGIKRDGGDGTALTSENSRFRQYFSLARDLVISFAGLGYFIGFVYVYYYLDRFGIGVLSSAPGPDVVYMFAWEVIRRDSVFAFTFVVAILVFGLGLNYVLENLAATEPIASRIEAAMEKLGTPFWDANVLRRLLRWLGTLVAITPVFLMFLILQLLFDRSHEVASDDASARFQAAHLGVRMRFALHGSAPVDNPIPDLNCILRRINSASQEGRAILIAETADRMVFLVGTKNPDLDHPARRDINDHLYVIEKTLIAAEDLWSR